MNVGAISGKQRNAIDGIQRPIGGRRKHQAERVLAVLPLQQRIERKTLRAGRRIRQWRCRQYRAIATILMNEELAIRRAVRPRYNQLDVVRERAVEQGEFVTNGFVGDKGAKGYVVTLADLRDLQVELDISQNDFSKIHMGSKATVKKDNHVPGARKGAKRTRVCVGCA